MIPPVQAIGKLAEPVAVIDGDAFDANVAAMLQRAGGLPIRVASKSVRVRGLISQLLTQPGFAGVLSFSARESIFLVRNGIRDVVVAYPTVDREAIESVAGGSALLGEITFMVDCADSVDFVAAAAQGAPVRVCLDIDCSLKVGRTYVGAHRSRVRSPSQARELAQYARAAGLRVAGLMFYEAQVAGMPDAGRVIRLMKQRSMRQLMERRAAVVAAVAEGGPVDFVNAGGTGSLVASRADGVPTELAAGSGFFTPSSFDGYDDSGRRPAAYFVLPVVRANDDYVVTYTGGYHASGVIDDSRAPVPVYPEGLRFFHSEGAGEVQTPLRLKGARTLSLGDGVWFRHAKAGEMCERFNEVLLVRGGEVVDRLPTYRGEGYNFG